MPAWAKIAIDQWSSASGVYNQRVFRAGANEVTLHLTGVYTDGG
jgi:hypothetical protein